MDRRQRGPIACVVRQVEGDVAVISYLVVPSSRDDAVEGFFLVKEKDGKHSWRCLLPRHGFESIKHFFGFIMFLDVKKSK